LSTEVGTDRRAAGGDGTSSGSEEGREGAGQRHRAEDSEGAALHAEPAARAEEERLDRADGQAEHAGDLLVAAPLELAHHQGGALIEGEVGERGQHVVEFRSLVVEGRGLGSLLERNLARPAAGLAPAHPADVVRDRDQPVVRLLRALATLVRAVGVEEGGLGDIFRVSRVRQQRERVLVDLARVLSVELLEGTVAGPLEQAKRLPWSRRRRRAGCLHVAQNGERGRADTGLS